MTRNSTKTLALLTLMASTLGGCATSKDKLLPSTDLTMREIWNQNTGIGSSRFSRPLLDARQALRRPLQDSPSSLVIDYTSYTRTAANEIDRQFQRLPNPDLTMYVFPHLVGTDPVPGYSTVFPLHSRVQYAMPGERLEDY